MPLRDFMPGLRSVGIGGRVFRVRRPTVETVYRFLEHYPAEIHAIAKTIEESGPINPKTVLSVFLRRQDAAADILQTCVESEGDPSGWPLEQLAVCLLERCDVAKIAADLQIEANEPEAPAGGYDLDPAAEDLGLLALSREIGSSLVEIMSWPWDAYMSAQEAVMYGRGHRKRTEERVGRAGDTDNVLVM